MLLLFIKITNIFINTKFQMHELMKVRQEYIFLNHE